MDVYINRGKTSAEFGDSLYSVDIDDGEEITEEVQEVMKTFVVKEEKKDAEIEESAELMRK